MSAHQVDLAVLTLNNKEMTRLDFEIKVYIYSSKEFYRETLKANNSILFPVATNPTSEKNTLYRNYLRPLNV